MTMTLHENEDTVTEEGKTVTSRGVAPDKGAVNILLLVACVAFGSASFLFGYDDKVISPVAALDAFVSFWREKRKHLPLPLLSIEVLNCHGAKRVGS
jgi:hypothetical protein